MYCASVQACVLILNKFPKLDDEAKEAEHLAYTNSLTEHKTMIPAFLSVWLRTSAGITVPTRAKAKASAA